MNNTALSSVDLAYDAIAARLKLLAHPERLRILDAIRRDAECVCHLEALLGKPPAQGELPDLAHHKRVIACPCPKCNDTIELIEVYDA
jgi:DNA-binding transcriptional ArsR family regulator